MPVCQQRVLILALDAAEPSLLRRWADDGTLPAIKSLIDAGAVARLRNPPGLSGATWPTLNSGKTAASHARYYCCAWLTDELKAIEDADSGRPIVREVYKLAEQMRGPRQHLLPDLALKWDAAAPASRVRSPCIGELAVSVSPWRSGEHLHDGLVAVRGAGIQAGAADDLRAEDFAPSVAALLGLTLADVDGRAAPWLAP